MKNILVTGGCGFIGSNYIHHVLKKNNDIHIINLDKMTYAGNINNLNGIPKEFHTFVKGDICDSELLKPLFESTSPVSCTLVISSASKFVFAS